MTFTRITVVAVAALGTTFGATAQELTIGLKAEPSAIDPHYHNLGPNNQIRHHMFESLVWQDENQRLSPMLATSWTATDETTWEFKLREGVTFHDGTPFDAQDFIYTLCRIPNVVDSPSSFTQYTAAVQAVDVPDPHTLIITTPTPYPLLPTELANWGIISAEGNGGENAVYSPEGCTGVDAYPATADFNSGELAVGTGPYAFGEFVKADRLVLNRNDGYWGDAPHWETVTFKPIPSAGPRVAALLAGDVDVIENPPLQDLDGIDGRDEFKVVLGQSNRVIYLHMDQFDENTPGVSGVDGNPFLDVRVREAMSLALNREAIVARIMGGVAVVARQLLPEGMYGSNPDIALPAYDPERAKELLAEAGYPDGFELVIGTPNDRYINDEQVALAAAQFYTQIGIPTTIDASTRSVFFSRRNKYEFSMYLAGWGAGTGEMSSPLSALVATRDTYPGLGGTNRGRYSNPELDAMILEARATVDDTAREKLLQDASALAMADFAILPLHYEVTPWAMKSDLDYTPRTDQYTIAYEIKPVM